MEFFSEILQSFLTGVELFFIAALVGIAVVFFAFFTAKCIRRLL
jgi:hypothetical protein